MTWTEYDVNTQGISQQEQLLTFERPGAMELMMFLVPVPTSFFKEILGRPLISETCMISNYFRV
jgi:hypothetical protein